MKLIGRASAWLTGHARLLIEYALIAAVVSLGGAFLYAKIHIAQQETQIAKFGDSLASASSTIKAQIAVNHQQDQAISTLKELRQRDSDAIVGLQADISKADTRGSQTRAKLDQLEKNNARAKVLLDTVVPDDVGCVLDHRPCPAAGNDADKN
jgi:hypothetical protein